MFKNLQKKMKGDKADSNIVSLVILIPLIMAIFFSVIDMTAYFANKSQVYGMAHSGARSVAIFGGNGNANQSTKLEAKYGQTKSQTCGRVKTDGIILKTALQPSSTAIECNIMLGFMESAGLINVTVSKVKCTPTQTAEITARTSCAIDWAYGGTPGSTLSMINLFNKNVTAASSEAEVKSPGLTDRKQGIPINDRA